MTSFIAVLRCASVASAVAITTTVCAQSSPSSIDRGLRTIGRIAGQTDSTHALIDRMRYWRVPGVSIAVIDNFRIVHARGYGVTEFGGNTPVDTNTLFQAGSISKPVFATGALKLVEQGTLSLDEDVNSKLTSWKLPDGPFTTTEKVTLRRLLSHNAGLTVWGFPGYPATQRMPTVVEVLDGKGNTPPVRNDTTPGTRWLYSGGGYTVAQLLTTDVSRESFAELMQRLVLAPAGMVHSTYANPLPATHARFAASGHERIDTPVQGRYHTYPEMAAAGLWTTAPDLARWMLNLAQSYNGATSGILSPNMARQMIAKHVNTGPRGGNGWQGLGVAVAGDGDSINFSHGGRDEGFVANVIMWPKLGKGLVVLTNGVSGPLLAEIRRAFNDAYGMPGGPRPERASVAVAAASLSPLAGRYRAISPNGRDTVSIEVTMANGILTLAQPSTRRVAQLWPLGNDQFYEVHSNATFIFQREGDASSRAKALQLGLAPNAPVAVRVP
jgi:CubicO group peptidase (beta-lactamase class C family)